MPTEIKTILVCPPESYEGLSVEPEMLAAVSARISRNGGGLDELMETVRKVKDPSKIFKFIDYGHGSIEGLTGHIALFFEGVSILEMEKLFEYNYCYEAQETSTRYVEFSSDGVLSAGDIGITNPEAKKSYNDFIEKAFECYHKAVTLYKEAAKDIEFKDSDPKKRKRYERNWVFDKVRYLIPVTAKTSGIMMMTPRDWARTAKIFRSLGMKVFTDLGDKIVEAIRAVTPNLCRHADPDEISIQSYQVDVSHNASALVGGLLKVDESPWGTTLLNSGEGVSKIQIGALTYKRNNRYDILYEILNSISVDYKFTAITFAEYRDVNRMRSGGRCVDMLPRGLVIPDWSIINATPVGSKTLHVLLEELRGLYRVTIEHLAKEKLQWFGYLLGTQVEVHRTNTLRKTMYAVELRTGIGAHPEYAKFFEALGAQLTEKYGCNLLIGTAEPEVV